MKTFMCIVFVVYLLLVAAVAGIIGLVFGAEWVAAVIVAASLVPCTFAARHEISVFVQRPSEAAEAAYAMAA